ncbi:hypothetical protein C1H46_026464 [Malus baccata]|uniref:Longin domain-containing protein n=1 Tax=Malus baccata TaxID=106549 RepID=A0A540LNA3_MALBA|nr:hypothetical protein C1H46_026464 [Malus baccata]
MAPSLIYSFMMGGTAILAECPNKQDQEVVASLALKWLPTLPRSMNKVTYDRDDGYIFNYLIDGRLTYCVVAAEAIGREIPLAFLNKINKDFTGKYCRPLVEALFANSLNNELGSKMKVHMEHAEVKSAQVSKDKEVAIENIEKNQGLCLRRKSRSPSMIYSFMAHETVILADCLLYEDMAACMAVDMLPLLPRSINKITYDRDGYTINYLLDCNFTYCVVATEAIGRKIPLAFLDQIKKDLTGRLSRGLAAPTVPNSLNKEFRPKLKERMRYAKVIAAQVSIGKDDDNDDDYDKDKDEDEDEEVDEEEDEDEKEVEEDDENEDE